VSVCCFYSVSLSLSLSLCVTTCLVNKRFVLCSYIKAFGQYHGYKSKKACPCLVVKISLNCNIPGNGADWSHVDHDIDMMSRETRQHSGHLVQQRVVKVTDDTGQI